MMTMTTTSPLMVSSTTASNSTTTPTSVSRAKDISTIPTTTNDDDSLLSKSLGHYNPAQGTNMPRGSYHDIKSRYFMSLNLSSPHNTTPKTPPQQTSPSLPNSSGVMNTSGSLLTNNINRTQRTSSLSSQITRQTSPGQKPESRERRQTSYDFNRHSEAIPIPSKMAVPVAAESLMYNNNGTYDPSVVPSLMTDDSMPMMFDGDFSFTDSSESGSIDLSPFFTSNTQSNTSSVASSKQIAKPGKSNMKGSALNPNTTKKSVSIKIETTTSAVKDSSVSSTDSSESSEERSPLTPNRTIIPPHLMNNRSDFSLYRQQQKYNTKVYKI
ncbi:hypothetical protein NAEGRDRAFT_78478 [Naegleria gruberi]|uniref:Uncharacterized protein n=1 Tax=Naegleria gruberi TaxID=5762 RepID=D2V428_NAEGR|nr:uncharacterized protein NAEGRDRAFT_78478 [Naegleria gruberi]EFC48306.1 hypothetical protein NAEGRDRAFT_78478 [Naegleria gruberi]|eukprot:XP_002681050.1 hypothetical protein NAEGRDRAFT_78478 [Naegleria gruberi strain NEG-M]